MMSGEFMLEMAWKSALIAGAALLVAGALRSRAAADRSAVLRVAVALLLALPILSLNLPALQVIAWTPDPIEVPANLASLPALAEAPALAASPAEPTIWDDPTILFLLLYLGGVAMAAARLGGGLATLGRWTREAEAVDCPHWAEAFERCARAADAPASLTLKVSTEVPSPLSWGLVRPVILIDRETLGHVEDADAILAHEIAHVVRRDWAVLMLARIAVALFWFNPLVRLLEREMVQQAEEAADIEAARAVEPARYAQTLVHWAQFATAPIPAHAISPGASALARRVRAILDSRRRSTPAGSGWSLAAIAGCGGFALAVAMLQPIAAAAEIRAIPAIAPPAAAATPQPAVAPQPLAALAAPSAVAAPLAASAAPVAPVPAAPATPAVAPVAPRSKMHLPAAAMAVHPVDPLIDEAALERQIEAAVAASIDSRRIAAQARASARAGVIAGIAGIEAGAAGLEEGARQMEREARALDSRPYRERRIAASARIGETLTHETLIEVARSLRDSARDMNERAREMRQTAAERRRAHH